MFGHLVMVLICTEFFSLLSSSWVTPLFCILCDSLRIRVSFKVLCDRLKIKVFLQFPKCFLHFPAGP